MKSFKSQQYNRELVMLAMSKSFIMIIFCGLEYIAEMLNKSWARPLRSGLIHSIRKFQKFTAASLHLSILVLKNHTSTSVFLTIR